MNKSELVAIVADNTGISNAVANKVVDVIADTVSNALARGEEVTLHGIGKLSVKDRPARVGRNPATGEDIKIPAKRVPKFSAAKALKDAVAAPAKKGKK
ncbi:MAG: HU family DNA-binding protein [Pseudomonadota bacterium]